ncbi:DUF4199 domain-containing protein [Winogradskyella sp. PC-19]|uniref:DUF4199 domain-containing protein n=1 Tax=unclassified Winogradskyella TaxID=2615021 RepID=UPI000B3C1676|nr:MULTISPECIES: DUF4199 domain-containing protein [unclassified Winogradskyella]ARV08883.1 DUF4199 domain-containing protein [Winogradskyella sp. PC-19]RZN78447.1 MAG: DUF4199 domain-containing protein [Winogradskyella sp.]
MEKSIKSNAINYGLYLGIALAAINILIYVIDIKLFNSLLLVAAIFISIIVFGVLSINSSKKILGGFISFKKAFTSYFITIALGLFISSTVYFLIFNVVDTEAAQILAEMQVENQVKMMENFGAPQESIDQAVVQLQENDPFSLGNQFLGYSIFLVIMSLIGLIVAAVTKKNDPNEA